MLNEQTFNSGLSVFIILALLQFWNN